MEEVSEKLTDNQMQTLEAYVQEAVGKGIEKKDILSKALVRKLKHAKLKTTNNL